MTLPYEKKQLDAAKARQVPLFKLDLDYRHVKTAPMGMVSRTGLLTVETAEAIMKLIDEDPASKSEEQLAELEKKSPSQREAVKRLRDGMNGGAVK